MCIAGVCQAQGKGTKSAIISILSMISMIFINAKRHPALAKHRYAFWTLSPSVECSPQWHSELLWPWSQQQSSELFTRAMQETKLSSSESACESKWSGRSSPLKHEPMRAALCTLLSLAGGLFLFQKFQVFCGLLLGIGFPESLICTPQSKSPNWLAAAGSCYCQVTVEYSLVHSPRIWMAHWTNTLLLSSSHLCF